MKLTDYQSNTKIGADEPEILRAMPSSYACDSVRIVQSFGVIPIKRCTKTRKRKRDCSKRKVHFANKVRKIRLGPSMTHNKNQWWSYQDCRRSYESAKQEVKMLVKTRKAPFRYLMGMESVFFECIRQRSLPGVYCMPCSIQTIDASTDTPCNGTLRGLEPSIIPSLSQYRRFHIQSLLKLQRSVARYSANCREDILKARSQHTSRANKIFARIMGHADSKQVLSMLQEELHELENS